MKKMFFSAVALVAFSAISMASVKEVKSVKPASKKIVALTCLDNWMPNYNQYKGRGFSDSQAISLANIDYRACLSKTSISAE